MLGPSKRKWERKVRSVSSPQKEMEKKNRFCQMAQPSKKRRKTNKKINGEKRKKEGKKSKKERQKREERV